MPVNMVNSDVGYIVAKQRAILCSEMVYGRIAIGAYEIHAVGACAYPFPVGAINTNARNVCPVQQVVSQVSTVISWNAHSVERHPPVYKSLIVVLTN